MRYKCANCGFVFDSYPGMQTTGGWMGPGCPNCGSNACDPISKMEITIHYHTGSGSGTGGGQPDSIMDHKDRRGG